MLNGRAVRERQLIQMKRTDRVHKSACHLSDWLVKCRAAYPFLFGFKPERPCFEKISRGHKILLGGSPHIAAAIIRSASYTCPACHEESPAHNRPAILTK